MKYKSKPKDVQANLYNTVGQYSRTTNDDGLACHQAVAHRDRAVLLLLHTSISISISIVIIIVLLVLLYYY